MGSACSRIQAQGDWGLRRAHWLPAFAAAGDPGMTAATKNQVIGASKLRFHAAFLKFTSGQPPVPGGAAYTCPTTLAVAISSSINAKETWPETAYGFSSACSLYLRSVLGLIRLVSTKPMVQPPNRRSVISS